MKELKIVKTIEYEKDGSDWIEYIEYLVKLDDDMFEVLSKYAWYTKLECGDRRIPYFYTRIRGHKNPIQMHYFISGQPIHPYITDHKDGDTCNMQSDNLASVTRRQNNQNRHVTRQHNLPGVFCYPGRHLPWGGQIQIGDRTKIVGRFDTKVEAFFAYKQAVEDLGEFITPWVLEKCYKIIDTEMVHI